MAKLTHKVQHKNVKFGEMEAPFNSPNQWLRDALQDKRLSTSGVARQLCLSAPQLSHWVNGQERIPRHHLLELAELLDPQDGIYVGQLKDCEDFLDQLHKAAQNFAADDQGLATFVESRVCEKLHTLLSQELDSTPAELVSLGVRFLAAAHFCLRRAISLRDNPAQPLVGFENVRLHLRYPYNHFLGLLIDLPTHPACQAQWHVVLSVFRQDALRSLRESSRAPGDSSSVSIFIRHHATHLLAQHGELVDQESVERIISHTQLSKDAMLHRLAYAGLSLTGRIPELAQRYLQELRRNEALRLANVRFDAIHYGDISLEQDLVPAITIPNTVNHVLRHILCPEHYRSIGPVEQQTITDIFELFGQSAFQNPRALNWLQHLLLDGNESLKTTELSSYFIKAVRSIVNELKPPEHAQISYGGDVQ